MDIELPLSPLVRVAGPAVILLLAGVAAMHPVAESLKWPAVALLLLFGAGCWVRFLRGRAVGLQRDTRGLLLCTLANGRSIQIEKITPGLVSFKLLTALLHPKTGTSVPLFVTKGAVNEETHRVLRTLVLSFRSKKTAP